MTLFSGKKSIFMVKISDDLFKLLTRMDFSNFLFLLPNFPYLSYVQCRKNTSFYSFHTFPRIRQHYTSRNIGGMDAWAVPHLKFLGDHPPSPSRSPPLMGPTEIRKLTPPINATCLVIHDIFSAFGVPFLVGPLRSECTDYEGLSLAATCRPTPLSTKTNRFSNVYLSNA